MRLAGPVQTEAAASELLAYVVAAPPWRSRGRALRPARQAPDAWRAGHDATAGPAVLAGVTARRTGDCAWPCPAGIWLDEAISIHQANLAFHDMFENLQYGDRHPPLHHMVLWLTVRAFGDGELAVRLPSLIAGTLVIPALYLLGTRAVRPPHRPGRGHVRHRLPAAHLVRAGSAHVRLRDPVRPARPVDAAAGDPRRRACSTGRPTSSPPRRSCGRTTSACC